MVVRANDEMRARVPILALGGIVCFGVVTVSPPLMALCGEKGVTVTYVSEHGRYLGRVVGPTTGNVLLRREQYRRTDDGGGSASVARAIVAAKIANARSILLRGSRERDDAVAESALGRAATELACLLEPLAGAEALNTIRGIEGAAARVYFGAFGHLVGQQRESFPFGGRSRRPPADRLNAMLSFVYTLLVHDYVSALEAVGLDPYVGFLHRERPGRPSLALDLTEELRAWMGDRLVLSLVNLRQVGPDDFAFGESGGVSMSDEARKTLLAAYQKRKQEDIVHPFLGEKTSIGLISHLQATLLARHLRGDLDAYPPFAIR